MGIKFNPITIIRAERPDTHQTGDERVPQERQAPNIVRLTDFLAQSQPQLRHPYFDQQRVARARTACDMEMAEGPRRAQEALDAFSELVASNPDDPQVRQMMRFLLGA